MSDSETYYLKWKGQTAGPFRISEIEAKLQGREISALYEIQSEGRWITIREFFAQSLQVTPISPATDTK